MYISPQYNCIKKSLRSILQKSVDKTFSKKTKLGGGGGGGGGVSDYPYELGQN